MFAFVPQQERENLMKKLISVFTALLLLVTPLFSGCGNGKEKDPSVTDESNVPLKLGVIQYAPHPSLDNCYIGFIEGLAEQGYIDGENISIEFQNANGDPSTADMQAKNFAFGGYELIMAIATPAAMSAYAATKESGLPVIFNAVSDPVAAGIVASIDAPGTNCTGSSDVLNFDRQLAMIREFLPDATVIGVIYTTSESNSASQLKRLTDIAGNYGFTIEAVGVSLPNEVAQAAASLVAKGVDCLNNLTDNNVVNHLSSVLHVTDEAGVPVFGSEEEQVRNGCLASESIDYVELGRVSGRMAAAILRGDAKPESLAVSTESECYPVYNSDVAARLGISLPESTAGMTDVV